MDLLKTLLSSLSKVFCPGGSFSKSTFRVLLKQPNLFTKILGFKSKGSCVTVDRNKKSVGNLFRTDCIILSNHKGVRVWIHIRYVPQPVLIRISPFLI